MVSGFHKHVLVVAVVKFMMLCTLRMTDIPVYVLLWLNTILVVTHATFH